jgi:hypothetical protein
MRSPLCLCVCSHSVVSYEVRVVSEETCYENTLLSVYLCVPPSYFRLMRLMKSPCYVSVSLLGNMPSVCLCPPPHPYFFSFSMRPMSYRRKVGE